MNDLITQSITRTYRYGIWSRFIKGLKEYSLLKKDDVIMLLLSNKKEVLLLAKLFAILKLHSDFNFDIKYVVIKKDFNQEQLELLRNNIKLLKIEAIEFEDEKRDINYNVLIDFKTYDDIIVNTLESIIFNGVYKTIIPLKKDGNISKINPLYFVRDKDISNWVNYNNIQIEEDIKTPNYIYTKDLINKLLNYNEFVEMNIFKSSTNVNLDKVLGYFDSTSSHEFNEYYEKNRL